MDFNLLADSEARSPALSLSDSGTPQHDQGCKGQDHSGESDGALLFMNQGDRLEVQKHDKC